MCGINHCTNASRSIHKMKHHMSKDHRVVRTAPLMSFVQVIFESNGRRYPVTVSPLVQPSSSSDNSTQSPLQIILKQYSDSSNMAQLLDVPDDPAGLNPFLTKYRWLTIMKGLSPVKVRDWVSLPCDRNLIFKTLEVGVEKYYEKIRAEIESLDQGLDINCRTLRWINSTKE